jgi:hypothetical protein
MARQKASRPATDKVNEPRVISLGASLKNREASRPTANLRAPHAQAMRITPREKRRLAAEREVAGTQEGA